MDTSKVPPASDQLRAVLDSPEIEALIVEIEALRWTGRPGYGVRAMIGMALAKAIYALPTWSRIARLVAEHSGLRDVLGCAPSQWACYRFCTGSAASASPHSALHPPEPVVPSGQGCPHQ